MNIHETIKKLVEKERLNTHQILLKLNELFAGRLYAELGYSSLFDYCTQELKYSSDQACRRISAAKILRAEPSVAKSIENGNLTITHLSKAQTLFNQVALAPNEKLDLLKRLENTSNFEAEKIICTIHPKKKTKEKMRPIQDNSNELKIFIDNDLLEKLILIKELSKKDNWQETIAFLCAEYLKKSNELNVKTKMSKEVPSQNSRYIPMIVKGKILTRAQHQCEFIAKNGTRCSSRYKLEYAHIIPYAHGGLNSFDNIFLCCKSHNQLDALIIFGADKVKPYFDFVRN